MPSYRFYAPADAAQDKIWEDIVKQWGEARAETYLRGLHANLQRLISNPWRNKSSWPSGFVQFKQIVCFPNLSHKPKVTPIVRHLFPISPEWT